MASASAVTAQIAARVKAARDARGISGAALVELMREYGITWDRTAVAKLETGKRGAVSVEELLALALALDVPPITLIADPRPVGDVPVGDVQITPNLTADAWEALLWLTGSGTIAKSGAGNFASSAWLIQAGWTVVECLAELHKRDRVFDPNDAEQVEQARLRDDARHRSALAALVTAAVRIRAAGAPLPPMIPLDAIRRRAAELDVELPHELTDG
ncbi:MAG: helix-turn-helix domain-containing protein [Actinomycetia bacterium]|nr:helix-turn-helix domain-containing protein [Actinomycetes bacterium]